MERRFGWVLSGKRHGPNRRVDVDLTNHGCAAVVPTLGSLVPGWALVVPRQEVLSVAALDEDSRRAVASVAHAVATRLSAFQGDIYFLEHGAGKLGSDLGCGVDQAHLHVLPLQFDLKRDVLADPEISWSEVDTADPWKLILPGDEYYYIGTAQEAFIGLPNVLRKQYFRRQIARNLGVPDKWDYREWPFHEHAQRTIQHLGCEAGELRAA